MAEHSGHEHFLRRILMRMKVFARIHYHNLYHVFLQDDATGTRYLQTKHAMESRLNAVQAVTLQLACHYVYAQGCGF